MLVSRAFVEQIGSIDESYFIYYEELDWAERARGRFTLGYAPDSVIYHKEGAAIGTNANRKTRSLTSEKYQSKNRVVFAKRFCPWTLPTVLMTVCATALQRLCTGDAIRAKVILEGALRGLAAPSAVIGTLSTAGSCSKTLSASPAPLKDMRSVATIIQQSVTVAEVDLPNSERK
jgi:hypothetical protein